jgi:hypothetical protein
MSPRGGSAGSSRAIELAFPAHIEGIPLAKEAIGMYEQLQAEANVEVIK